MAGDTSEDSAAFLHGAILEVLKQLNRAEAEEDSGEGLESSEILVLLRKGPLPMLTDTDFERALSTLVANQMAEVLDSPQYAWDRGRILGRRYALTRTGKVYLLEQLAKTGRVE
ncbi:MAG: hypothetical protein ACLPZM_02770 [Thermoplasmata archaeon]